MRLYLPTLADLIDRLSIVLLKITFGPPETTDKYLGEAKMILHDIGEVLGNAELAQAILASLGVMLSNQYIWHTEDAAREGKDQDLSLLRITHSVNTVRVAFKNAISAASGERQEWKNGCLGSELPGSSNWKALVSTLSLSVPEDGERPPSDV